VGSVDDMGIAAKGEAAVGLPIFIMTKVRFSHVLGLLKKKLMQFPVSGKIRDLRNAAPWPYLQGRFSSRKECCSSVELSSDWRRV